MPWHHHLKNAFIPHEGNDYRPHALRHHWLGFYAAVLLGVKILTVGVVGLLASRAIVSDITSSRIIALTNQTRQAQHLSTLNTNTLLNQAAQSKGNDMLREQYFAHVSPSNLTPWYWFKQAGYTYQYAGENLAIDFLESEDIITAWLASPSHRANLLSTKYQDIGVAVVSGNFQGAQSVLVVQMLGAQVPKQTTTVVTTPSQTPSPVTTQKELAQAPAPTPAPAPSPTPAPAPTPKPAPPPPPPIPPTTPTIATPDAGSVVRTTQPTIVGQAEAGSTVQLLVDSNPVGNAVTGSDGVYSVELPAPLTDGRHLLSASASARGLQSLATTPREIVVDTLPPEVNEQNTFALFSILSPDTYDVQVATSGDATSVNCFCGATVSALTDREDVFTGQITLNGKTSAATLLSLTVNDSAGNSTKVPLVDTELFTSGVAAAQSGPFVTALNVLNYSRGLMLSFLVVLLIMALLNVIIHIERQHRPTLLGVMMVIYLTSSLLLL